MITPTFRLEQDADHLYIVINAPFAKLDEYELSIDDNDFRFYCKPYYLRLNLPGKIVDTTENKNEIGRYDFENNCFKFKLMKQQKGENFEGLDLVTKLLTIPKKKESVLIEELNNEENNSNTEDSSDEWYIDQNINNSNENDEINLNNKYKYGFALSKSNVFSKISSDYLLIFDLYNPDETSYKDRKKQRIENENDKFDEDYYLADIYENELIEENLLKYKPYWHDKEELSKKLEYTEEELDCLKSLPKKTYLLDKKEKIIACTTLIDILYAYCYNNRVNCGEENVESGWTITKLSSSLSWFDTFNNLEDVIIASFRRSLCFPLYRNWKLNEFVYNDLKLLLKSGTKLILKILIEIRKIFNKSEYRYLLNDLFINDYCVWIQYNKEKTILSIADALEEIKISKTMVDFDLECIELAAEMAFKEQDEATIPEIENNEIIKVKNNKEFINESEEEEEEEEDNDDEINEEEISDKLSKFLNIGDQLSNENKPKIVELD